MRAAGVGDRGEIGQGVPRRCVAIVPVKGAASSKSRLAPVLSAAERERLVLWMLARVVRAAQGAGLEVRAVGGDPPVATLCRELRCAWSGDRGGLNPSVTAALHEAAGDGYQVAVVLPADVPWVEPADILELLSALAEVDSVVLVPSPDGGTNALALHLPARLPACFGPSSFAHHREQATRAGLRVVVALPPGLVRDIDEPDDLTPDLLHRVAADGCALASPGGGGRAGGSGPSR